MRHSAFLVWFGGAVACLPLFAACTDDLSQATQALSAPRDFTYACEGPSKTQALRVDETASSFGSSRVCPDVTETVNGQAVTREGDLFGLILNHEPPGVVVSQLNRNSGASVGILDADRFTPGYSPIPVGDDPIRLIRAPDSSSAYAVSAGDKNVTRVIIEGLADSLSYASTTEFSLPGVPGDAALVGSRLVVVPAWAKELWVYDLAADAVNPPLTTVSLPDVVDGLAVLGADELLLTWVERPVLTRYHLTTGTAAEAGLTYACSDTLDNDGDGQTDRDDPDCRDQTDNTEQGACSNGTDDDGDGQVDGSDPDCAPGPTADFGTAYTPPTQCSDGVDNDGDGSVDTADSDCASATDTLEGVEGCRDGVDNDSDGLTDHPDDPDCGSPSDVSEGTIGCADGIDNDGDGFTDTGDPGCSSETDSDETDAACSDGIDNDGDGLTDYPNDPACTRDNDNQGEYRAACSDGLDNDGDGLTDMADGGCWTADDRNEGHAPDAGPYIPVVVDGSASGAGLFAYVLDQKNGALVVFDLASSGLNRVSVYDHAATIPKIEYKAYDATATATETIPEQEVAALPGLAAQGLTDLILPSTNALSLLPTAVRGELWTRLIAPASGQTQAAVPYDLDSTTKYIPQGCEPGRSDACWQPPGDGDSVYVFAPLLDAGVLVIQAIRRGVAVHRLLEPDEDREDRTVAHSGLALALNGVGENTAQLLAEFPFLGPIGDDEVQQERDEAAHKPRLVRHKGIWPVDEAEVEKVVSEGWSVVYEGAIIGTDGLLGKLVAADTFYAPGESFCSSGVKAGDVVTVKAPTAMVDRALRYPVPVEVKLDNGRVCPVKTPAAVLIDVPVTAVRQTHLVLDPSKALLRANVPILDEEALAAQAGLSRSQCTNRLNYIRRRLTVEYPPQPTTNFTVDKLPPRFAYEVRPVATWTITGGASGFLHRNVWNAEAATCDEDTSLDARLNGRAIQATRVTDYQECPPPRSQIIDSEVEAGAIIDTSNRFVGYGFKLDIFPACQVDSSGAITDLDSQRDTRWNLNAAGPHGGSRISIANGVLAPRLQLIGERREPVVVDTSGNRVQVFDFFTGPRTTSTAAVLE